MSPIIETERGKILQEVKETNNMPKDAFIIVGPPTSGKSTQGIFLAETVRGHILRGRDILPERVSELEKTRDLIPDEEFLPALESALSQTTSSQIILDNVPRTLAQAEVIAKWSRNKGVNLHVIQLKLTEDQVVNRVCDRRICPQCGESYHPQLKPSLKNDLCDKDQTPLAKRSGDDALTVKKGYQDHQRSDQKIVSFLISNGAVSHSVSAVGTVFDTAKRLFPELSPVIFYKGPMAENYLKLRETLNQTESRHMLFSGMPVFMYEGRALMKDFDILVPNEDIDKISSNLSLPVGTKDSSVATTKFVDIAPGVEINSNLVVKTPQGNIEFPFDFLWEEAVHTRFMGIDVPLMGLEDTVLFKAALGRVGLDDWGKHKDDLSDIEGLMGNQNIDWKKLIERAKKLNMMDRLQESLTRIQKKIPSEFLS